MFILYSFALSSNIVV